MGQAAAPASGPRAIGYAATMSFSAEDLDRLDRTQEVEIETQAPGREARRTVIWIVVDDGEVFVRSVRGERARWYRDGLANPAVAIHADGRRIPATAITAADPDSVDRMNAGIERKYRGDPAIRSMLRPAVLPTTLRLEPA